jgi:hypothetical protein
MQPAAAAAVWVLLRLTLRNCPPCEKPIMLKPPLSSSIDASSSQTLPTWQQTEQQVKASAELDKVWLNG